MSSLPPSIVQARILSARYSASMTGDIGTLLLLLLQAPFIGWLCTIVWGSIETDTESLYFVLSLSAMWFGCINSCREIVKDRAIFERERLLGVSIVAYIWSRINVLARLAIAQVLLLQMAVEWSIGLRGPFLIQTLALWGCSLCGVVLGLLVSALSRAQERAVGAVPLLILPQILFSDLAIPRTHFTTLVAMIENCMPVRWSHKVFVQLAALETDWLQVCLSFVVLAIMSCALSAATYFALLPKREVI
jgi:ABC transport system ATP-binding/permease protein